MSTDGLNDEPILGNSVGKTLGTELGGTVGNVARLVVGLAVGADNLSTSVVGSVDDTTDGELLGACVLALAVGEEEIFPFDGVRVITGEGYIVGNWLGLVDTTGTRVDVGMTEGEPDGVLVSCL